jgi:IS30 family transposase
VEDRAVPGHWEGDLLCGSKNSNIVTLVERHSRYVMLAKVPNRETQTVVNALIKQARKLPDELYKSLTWDRGKELAGHQRFTMETNIAVYFCDPQSPWQRGSNENTNRLLRQYFPRGTDLAPHTQAHLNKVARQLKERPRKTLDFQTPAERFSECVASTDGAHHRKTDAGPRVLRGPLITRCSHSRASTCNGLPRLSRDSKSIGAYLQAPRSGGRLIWLREVLEHP